MAFDISSNFFSYQPLTPSLSPPPSTIHVILLLFFLASKILNPWKDALLMVCNCGQSAADCLKSKTARTTTVIPKGVSLSLISHYTEWIIQWDAEVEVKHSVR